MLVHCLCMSTFAEHREGTSPPQAAPTVDWGRFVLVGSILGLTQLGFFLTAAALPLYLHDLGAPQGRIGLDIGLGNFAALAVTLVLGPAINRRGPETFLRVGGLLYVLTAVGMLLIGNELAVTIFRTFQGIGTALIGPSAFTLGARLIPHRKATAIGILGVLNNVALGIGPPVGLTLYTQHGAAGLFLPAAIAAGVGLASMVLIPSALPTHKAAPGFGFDRSWTPALASNVLAAIYFGGILAYLPLSLQHVHGPNAGIFFTADAIGVLLMRIPTGMLADRGGSFVPKLIGLVVTLPGIAALALTPSIATLGIAGAATGIGAGLFITGVYADLSKLSVDANRGTAMSLGNGTFSGAIFLGSSISGLLIGPGGFNAILLFGAITCAAALPFVFFPRSEGTSTRESA
ncbi:MAG: hypothetical protein NVSMB52_01850 [Chloroflexota bacterium]